MPRIRHFMLTAAVALATAAPAAAATDGTSNTLMTARAAGPVQGLSFTAIEFKNTGAFMDYTDDDGLS